MQTRGNVHINRFKALSRPYQQVKKIVGANRSYRYKIAIFNQYQVIITSRCKRYNLDC